MKGPWSDIPSIKQASQAVCPSGASAAGCVWGLSRASRSFLSHPCMPRGLHEF